MNALPMRVSAAAVRCWKTGHASWRRSDGWLKPENGRLHGKRWTGCAVLSRIHRPPCSRTRPSLSTTRKGCRPGSVSQFGEGRIDRFIPAAAIELQQAFGRRLAGLHDAHQRLEEM